MVVSSISGWREHGPWERENVSRVPVCIIAERPDLATIRRKVTVAAKAEGGVQVCGGCFVAVTVSYSARTMKATLT
jgi:hypothetical protein